MSDWPPSRDELLAFIEARICPEPNTGCFIWLGGISTDNKLPVFELCRYNGGNRLRRRYQTKREMLAFTIGSLPDNIHVQTTCGNNLCVNPDHLCAAADVPCIDCGGKRDIRTDRGDLCHRCRACRNAEARRRRKSDPDKTRETNRRHYERNREQIRSLTREWRKNHPDLVREQQARRLRSMHNVPGSHTDEEWIACIEYHFGRCAYCDASNKKLTKDHVVPISLGRESSDDIWNIVPACKSCNSRKGNRGMAMLPEHEFIFLQRQPKKTGT